VARIAKAFAHQSEKIIILTHTHTHSIYQQSVKIFFRSSDMLYKNICSDSDVTLSTIVTAAMLEVYYAVAVWCRKLQVCLQSIVRGRL